jgi:Bax protein
MKLFSITFIIAGLLAFAIANEQMNNCTDDGCADFYDGKEDTTPAPIVKIEPANYIVYTPVVNTTNGKDEFVMSLSQCIDYLYTDLPKEQHVPKKIIIAQAALETGWGTSRFANEGNNLFGIRTFNKDSEWLLPIGWDQNKWIGWGVKVYNNKCDSVKDYIRIINTVFAYEEFRELREQNADVYELVDTLDKYATKQTYTELVKKVIKYNIEGVYEL